MAQPLISEKEMIHQLTLLFLQNGFNENKAQTLAQIFTSSTLDGIQSHGINRVPLFIEYVKKGIVKPNAEPSCVSAMGGIERWDGHQGPGILNALKCSDRAIHLARESGMGLVALRNTNHWLRGGSYGWKIAEAGCIGILFTNTTPNMPAWGGQQNRLGNNPLVISIPRPEGHVVLDMAMSQYSFGKIHQYQLNGESLPFAGGYDHNGQLTHDPQKIMSSGKSLPIGYWKGSALSMVLDMLATLLSAGQSTYEIGKRELETNLSQIYLVINPHTFHDEDITSKLINEIITYSHDVVPNNAGRRTYYPGERTLATRMHNKIHGIPVNADIWNSILNLIDG
ncbi:3-dehydro-L-gulonate 2-dehydrogenase [Membranihabitans marinus]|uniref:3-dehydro-L-gulonate 2-dehydrogenase n=1 Tax=Membranihabitans marinus TaxID=1227546 RepID=UPI001F022C55|nr:3-dehydro-L-gulonate 2-dehydrogenase [Membranihabitans marinus]